MSNHLLKSQVNQAVSFVQKNWQRLRIAAGNAYDTHGRGAFPFDLTNYQDAFNTTPGKVTYLDVASASNVSDGFAQMLLESEIQAYDLGRQIAFIFWHPDLEEASIRVLTETPDGNPLLGFDRRWNNAPRSCPKCDTEFVEPGPWGKCPKCHYEFVADHSNQETDMVHVPPIVTE